jgi:predicted amidohydrolase
VTVVAGSILLPDPSVRDGVVVAGRGPVQNVSAVFGPDGRAHPALARKAFPTRDELPFVSGAPLESLPVFETPAGRLGVLVCADSWQPAAYARLQAQAVALVAVPSAILNAGLWDKPWGGYDGAAAPSDVDARDVGALTEGQAWRKYAMGGRLREAGGAFGMNVFLRGSFWDTGSDGHSLAVRAGEPEAETKSEGAALLNVWL